MGSASDRRCSGCVQLALRSQPVLAAKALNPDEMNSAVQVYMQLGPYGFRLRALQLLCQQILNEPLFNELRTEQQLGYSVHIAPSTLPSAPALRIALVCPAVHFHSRARRAERRSPTMHGPTFTDRLDGTLPMHRRRVLPCSGHHWDARAAGVRHFGAQASVC